MAELDPASVAEAITPATRLVAVTAASNLLGTRPPVRQIADAAHAVGALVYVDGVHATAHGLIDVAALGADFFMCSPYKFLGPHCALLAAAPELLGDDPPRQAAAVDQQRARAARARHAALRDHGRRDRGDRLPGGHRPGRGDLGAGGGSLHRIPRSMSTELRLRTALEAGLASFGDKVVVHSRRGSHSDVVALRFRAAQPGMLTSSSRSGTYCLRQRLLCVRGVQGTEHRGRGRAPDRGRGVQRRPRRREGTEGLGEFLR